VKYKITYFERLVKLRWRLDNGDLLGPKLKSWGDLIKICCNGRQHRRLTLWCWCHGRRIRRRVSPLSLHWPAGHAKYPPGCDFGRLYPYQGSYYHHVIRRVAETFACCLSRTFDALRMTGGSRSLARNALGVVKSTSEAWSATTDKQRHHVDAPEDYAQHPPGWHPGEYCSLAIALQWLTSSRTISTRWRYARIPLSPLLTDTADRASHGYRT
jgi:hypothetical protein